jgi:hypothetical protein
MQKDYTVTELAQLVLKGHTLREASYIKGTGFYNLSCLEAATAVCEQHPKLVTLVYLGVANGELLDTFAAFLADANK